MQRGNKIEAIRIVREQTGLGLKESKDLVEAHESARAVRRGSGAGMSDGLSPGEVGRGGTRLWWLVAAAVVVAAWMLWP